MKKIAIVSAQNWVNWVDFIVNDGTKSIASYQKNETDGRKKGYIVASEKDYPEVLRILKSFQEENHKLPIQEQYVELYKII
jgi:hypothetical protein